MDKSKLSDDEWAKLIAGLKEIVGIRVGCESAYRQFVEAVLWILRGGAQWRFLPERLGHWNSVFKRFARWSRFGVWEKILDNLSRKADLQNVCIDSTVIRAHACAAGAAKSDAVAEALGRSCGGFSCKIHALTDALGLPVRFILTGGQAADITQAIPLMEGIGTSVLKARQICPDAVGVPPARCRYRHAPEPSIGLLFCWRGRPCADGQHQRPRPRGPGRYRFQLSCPWGLLPARWYRCGSLENRLGPLRQVGSCTGGPGEDHRDCAFAQFYLDVAGRGLLHGGGQLQSDEGGGR